jgi:hypothetical protein
MYTTGKLLDFYWWLTLNVLPAEVYPLWYRSIDLSTDPGLKLHLITCTYSEYTASSIGIFYSISALLKIYT